MKITLSQTQITSFAGNVVPLRLLGVAEYAMADISWEVSDPCVQITTFHEEKSSPFTDGVLLTFLREGNATVTASYEGQVYTCQVCIHERTHTPSQKGLSYYIGNFHDHTARTHDPIEFPLRQEGIPADYLKQLIDEGQMTFTVISDHAGLLNGREFFRGFWDSFCLEDKGMVVFPGSEAEVSPLWDDRYGIEHKLGGEVVVVNADSYAESPNWDKFFVRYGTSPFAIGVLAHPQIIGISKKGIWNFALDQNRTPRLQQLLRGVEMGNGTLRSGNIIHEYTYSVALDNGFRVSATCSSDCHGPVWGAKTFPGKTIIMAPEKSKEAFLDALDSCRFYASESGNVKLYYEVNGQPAPGTLPFSEVYQFHAEIGLLQEELGGMPVRLQVISDYGKTLFETDAVETEMDFTISSKTARYFYLRLSDKGGRHTWSAPVWTGRKFDKPLQKDVTPIDKAGFTATEETSGTDAAVLLNDDPNQIFFSQKGPGCSILIDMGKAETASALGLYHTMLDVKALRETGETSTDRLAELPVRYQLEVGLTPESMPLQAEGLFRVFGAEELIHFPAQKARYVRLRILSNAGFECCRPDYADRRVTMAELTVYR